MCDNKAKTTAVWLSPLSFFQLQLLTTAVVWKKKKVKVRGGEEEHLLAVLNCRNWASAAVLLSLLLLLVPFLLNWIFILTKSVVTSSQLCHFSILAGSYCRCCYPLSSCSLMMNDLNQCHCFLKSSKYFLCLFDGKLKKQKLLALSRNDTKSPKVNRNSAISAQKTISIIGNWPSSCVSWNSWWKDAFRLRVSGKK